MKARLLQTFLFTTGILLLSSLANNMQAQSEEQIKQFNQEKEDYFNEKLELSEAEKLAFWPVYNDFNSRKMHMMEEERNVNRYTRQNVENLSEKELKETMAQILKLKTGIMDLDREYYGTKFPEILGHGKTMELWMAEWDFRRHLIHRLRGKDGEPGKGRRDGSRGGPGAGPDSAPQANF